MRVLRGRAATPAADRQVTADLVEQTADTGESVVRVWQPHRQVAFGRRDRNRDGYEQARTIAADHGFKTTERAVGGHAVAFTGTTISFVRTETVDESRTGIGERYDAAISDLTAAFAALGIEVSEGEPDGAFCPGSHSLSTRGKIVGLAQRVKRDVATVGGIVVVADHDTVADVLEPVYGALGIPFERSAVGSVARAGGTADPESVVRTLETKLAGSDSDSVEQVRET